MVEQVGAEDRSSTRLSGAVPTRATRSPPNTRLVPTQLRGAAHPRGVGRTTRWPWRRAGSSDLSPKYYAVRSSFRFRAASTSRPLHLQWMVSLWTGRSSFTFRRRSDRLCTKRFI
jgi:hypothetical protein